MMTQEVPVQKRSLSTEQRESEALQIVKTYAAWSIVPGVLPTPLLDIALLIGIQLRMVAKLSELYQLPFSKNLGKSAISSLLAGIIPTQSGFGYLASVIKSVPVIGGVLAIAFLPAYGWAATFAVGKVFIQHFDSGGTLLTFNPAAVRDYFHQEFEREYAKRKQEAGSVQPAGKV